MGNKSWIVSLYPIGAEIRIPHQAKTGTVNGYTYTANGHVDGVTATLDGGQEMVMSWITLNILIMEGQQVAP